MQKGIITLLDILGWKGVWQRQRDENPLANLKKILGVAQQLCSRTEASYIREIDQVDLRPKFEVISISDTIAIVSYPVATPETEGSRFADHAIIASLLIRFSILHGIPLRGAMSVGSFSRDGNVLIGPAVDEVASWYEAADWIGVMACPSIYLSEEYYQDVKSMFIGFGDYKIPTKGRPTESMAIAWPMDWFKDREYYFSKLGLTSLEGLDLDPKNQTDLVNAFLKMGPLTPDIYPKFANTIEFYKFFHTFYIENKEEIEALEAKGRTPQN